MLARSKRAAIAAVLVVFRGPYERIGNTFAIWANQGVDRRIAATFRCDGDGALVFRLVRWKPAGRWTSLDASGFFVLMAGVASLAAVLLLVIRGRVAQFPESKSMESTHARPDSVTGV